MSRNKLPAGFMHQHSQKKNSKSRAFTIVELLAVIAIIAILAGIFFGVAEGVRERSRKSRAQSDLILLTQYLEQYKAHYGDFPRVQLVESNSPEGSNEREGERGNVALYNALNGMRAVDGTTFPAQQRAFIDRSKFIHEFSPSGNPPNPADPETAAVAILDPWGRAYRYYYPPPPTTPVPPPPAPAWRNPGYVLYSTGPSGQHTPPTIATDGYSDREDSANLDNISAN